MTESKFTPVEIAKIIPKGIWAEKDIMGTVHIYMQNEGDEPFEFITMKYHHHHTCNSHQERMTRKILALLGVEIDEKTRPYGRSAE